MNTSLRHFIVLLVLLVLGIFYLFPGVFLRGEVVVPADILFLDAAFSELVPEGWTYPNNGLLGDQIFMWQMYYSVIRAELQETGKLPLWNPYIYAGHPMLANAQSAMFYPPHLLFRWLTPGVVTTLRILSNFLVVGIGTYLFCRALGIRPRGSLLSAIAFAFSGVIVVISGWLNSSTLAWLPWMMLAVEKIVQYHLPGQRPRFTTLAPWIAVLAVSIALSVFAGHLQTFVHNLVLLGLYALGSSLLRLSSTRTRAVTLGILAGGVMLGLLLSAIQWLPFAEYTLANPLSRSRSMNPAQFWHSPEWLPNLAGLATLWFPNFYGTTAVIPDYYWPFSNFNNYFEQVVHFGAIPLALAVGGLFFRHPGRQKQKWLLLGIGLLALAIATRLPLFEGLNYLPGLNRVNNTRFKWWFSFCMAILAGFGLDALEDTLAARGQGRPVNRRFLAAVGTVFGLGTLFVICFYAYKYYHHFFDPLPPGTFIHHMMYGIFSLRKPATAWAVGMFLGVPVAAWFFWHWSKARPWAARGAIPLLMGVVIMDLLIPMTKFNTTVPPSWIFPVTTPIARLKEDPSLFRVVPTGYWRFGLNLPAAYGLFEVGGYDMPPNQAYKQLYNAQGAKGYQQAWQPTFPMLDFMNVKYVFLAEPLEAQDGHFRLFYSDEKLYIYENLRVFPRAYMVYIVDTIPDPKQAVERLVSGQFDFAQRAILETPLSTAQQEKLPAAPSLDGLKEARVEWRIFHADQVILSVDTPAAGVLVTSEVMAPGWRVKIDGEPGELLVVNHAFRGVFLEAGTHQVEMTYLPAGFTVGRWLSLLGLLLVGALFLAGRRNSKMNSPVFTAGQPAQET